MKNFKIESITLILILLVLNVFTVCKGSAQNLEGIFEAAANIIEEDPFPTTDTANNLQVYWGDLEKYFNIFNAEIGEQSYRDPLGRINEWNTLSFIVEAKGYFMIAIFFAYFYDSQGIEVAPFSPVEFNPDYSFSSWSQGKRSRARILIPEDLSNVAYIQFRQM